MAVQDGRVAAAGTSVNERTARDGHNMILSGTAAAWGEFCTVPFDTAKVRMQLQTRSNRTYNGLVDCLHKMIVNEGITAPWKGVAAGIQRQLVFAPIRIGLYEPVKRLYVGDSTTTPNILQKIAAGLTSSAIGITVASPTDVVKVRLQAQLRSISNEPPRYTGSLDAYKKIIAQEGVLGLWTGYGPNLARNCIVNATELVAYDSVKQWLLSSGAPDNALTHIGSGLSAGLAATLLGNPVDVIKSNVMNAQRTSSGFPVSVPFSGPVECAIWMFRTQGLLSFYKGVFPNFVRLGSWNVVTWLTFEQLKRLHAASFGS